MKGAWQDYITAAEKMRLYYLLNVCIGFKKELRSISGVITKFSELGKEKGKRNKVRLIQL